MTTRKEEFEKGGLSCLGMSYAKPFGNLNSEIPKMSHGYCDMPDAVNNDVQDRAAEGSSYHPTPCPLADPMG